MPRIMVVDDDEAMVDMMTDMLESLGHSVVTARDGQEALRLFGMIPVPLVITDILMPKIGGLSLINTIKHEWPGTKFIAVSGGGRHGKLNFLSTAKSIKGVETLAKPFSHSDFITVVQKLLG